MIETLRQEWPEDASLSRLRQIFVDYQQHPSPDKWDGVARLATK